MMPNGRVHCQLSEIRADACAHGRDPLSARLRARHASATLHCPVATAIAACPTTPQPAPPPYPICENHVTSPRPRLSATCTSTSRSSVYDASPSTSEGSMPASSSAALMAVTANLVSLSGSDLA